jgi:serine/threonine-protein kinase
MGHSLASPASPPKQFGPIRLIRPIGKGAMGEVWLARHELLGRDVAVKILSQRLTNQADTAFSEFIDGARVATSVEHPGLNKVYHADVADGTPYLVLEFLDGPNLQEVLERAGRLDLAAGRAMIEAMTGAVAELHNHDLAHRDLKPSNLVLTKDGRIVVTDFGLACIRPALVLRENSGIVAGTPAYMAPEMFDGVVSARTDVYAIGMTAYRLLAGRPAFEGTFDEVKHQHQSVAIDTEPLRAASAPDGVIDTIVLATSKDILFRPKSAGRLLDAFRTAFDAAGIQTASRDALRRLVREHAPSAGDPPHGNPSTAGSVAETVSQLAARKRELHSAEHIADPISSDRSPKADLANSHRRRAERRKVRIALVIASAAGAFVAAAVFAIFGRMYRHWEEGVVIDLAQTTHLRHVSFLATAGMATIWARLVLMLAPLGALMILALGAGTLAYRWLRGTPLPKDTENTLCGWCQHELRGVSAPLCTECGHRIGDQGPDEQGMLPLSRRRNRRLVMWLNLPLFFLVGIIVTRILVGVVSAAAHIPPTGPLVEFTNLFLVVFLGLSATLAFHEGFLQFNLAHCGRAWCRVCRGELKNLVEPVCPTCGERI